MKEFEEILRILKEHKDKLFNKYKVKEIGLFGSYGRGEDREKSDVDI